MISRPDPFATCPTEMKPWVELGKTLYTNDLEPSLRELVMTRAAQINKCVYCMHHHLADARKNGETEDRLHLLSAWRESKLYSKRERAALAWTEDLTLLAKALPSEAAFDQVREEFTEKEQVELTLLVALTNAWNRINVGLQRRHPIEKDL